MKLSFKRALLSLLVVVSFIILIDRVMATEDKDTIRYVSVSRQSHNNASGNFYLTFQIIGERYKFYVSDSFANIMREGDQVTLWISGIFKEVNQYHSDKGGTETHIMRNLTGLWAPLFMLLVAFLSLKYKEKLSTLTFVTEALILADFIYLIN